MNYPVVIHKDTDSDFGVTVPDLPGCFSVGRTMDDALTNAAEAIITHVEGLLLDREPVPEPTKIQSHQANADYSDGIWAMVYRGPLKREWQSTAHQRHHSRASSVTGGRLCEGDR